ncbi:hypothetical protein [Sorangium sp. So ce1099]|uniref:hypothetical protein n=1 Tax=Sorangium sp. So ce1099 TaxID=3133331 RepID=UPI003F610260
MDAFSFASEGLAGVLARLTRAMRVGGVLYASFKYGDRERVEADGRYFNDLDEHAFGAVLHQVPGLALQESWRTEDVRHDTPHGWLNLLLAHTG